MIEHNEHIDDLIGLVLTGQAADEVKSELQLWIEKDPSNAAYFRQMQALMAGAAASWDVTSIDVDAAWKRVENASVPGGRVMDIKRRNRLRWHYAVAAVAAGLLFTVFLFTGTPGNVEFAIHTKQEIVRDTLPGDLIATVNKNSNLQFEYNEKTGNRKAKLSGEAHFWVKHNPEKEFIIETQDVLIKDIGTVFNVQSYVGSDSILVSVSEGVVQFYSSIDEGVEISAGQVGIYVKSQKKFELKSVENEDQFENASGYADRQFRFRNTAISKVLERINEAYNERLELQHESMGNCRIIASFSDEDIDVIVGVIAESMGWKVSKSGSTYTFDGQGCE